MNNIRLVIAIPCSSQFMHRDWMIQFLNKYNKLQMELKAFGTSEDYVIPAVNNHANLPTNRNQLVRMALDKNQGNATHVLFLDSDIVMPDDSIEMMLKRDLPIHGLLCFTKNFKNPKPIIYKDGNVLDPIPEGMIEVDSTGCGCLMIKREVFVKIADLPEFKQNGGNFFMYKEVWSGNQSKKLSEDKYFCILARKAGFKIFVDTLSSCEHLTTKGVGVNEYFNARKPKDAQQLLAFENPENKSK